MRVPLLSVLLLFVTVTADAADWSTLWRTADQRGEQLLQRGDAANAVRTYTDPRRKAYAELKASDYAAAARDFAAFDDSDGQYNRGNALAHTGDLQSALKAYDAALAHDPHNQDAQHNRDLVARALDQQQQSQQQGQSGKSGDDKKTDKNASSQNSSGGSQSQGDNHSGKDADHQNEAGAQSSGKDEKQSEENRDQGKANEANAAKDQNKNQAQASGAQAQQGDQKQKGEESAQTNQGDQAAAQRQPQSADNAAEARRDAEAGLDKTPTDKTANSAAAQTGSEGSQTGTTKAVGTTQRSEQQLAEEQWLRRIPDDPGGLLRRKFLIEHMMRQQQTQP